MTDDTVSSGAADSTPVSAAPPPAPAPAPAPAPSFRESWPQEYQVDPAFKNFQTPEDLLKSYKHASSMVGLDKGEIIRKPATDAEWGPVYDALGRPKTADDYTVKPYEKVKFDDAAVKDFRELAHKSGWNQKQFESVMDWYASRTEAGYQEALDGRNRIVSEGEAKLREKWGQAYNDKAEAAKKAINQYGGEDLRKLLDETGVIHHPGLADALASLGESLREDTAFGSSLSSHGQRPLSPTEAQLEWNTSKLDQQFMSRLMNKNSQGHKEAVEKRDMLFKYMYPESKK